MRDIKFRAWTDEGMMPVTRLTFAGSLVYVYDSETDYEYQCNSDNLMQYTGLKDKNGVEIYEGDICTQLYIRKFGEQDNPRLQGQVTFDATRGWCVAFEPIWPNDIEVIGNIYQNKDLLKSFN